MRDLYVVVDIESDGKIPGDNNMLTLGAAPVIVDGDGQRLGPERFYTRLEGRPQAVSDKETMEWWSKQLRPQYVEAFLARPRQHPRQAMIDFANWSASLGEAYQADEVILAAAPIMFDGMWIRWYLEHYLGSCKPFSHRGFDLKSFWMGGGSGRTYARHAEHNDLFASLVGEQPETEKHHALHDAVYQANVLMRMFALRDATVTL